MRGSFAEKAIIFITSIIKSYTQNVPHARKLRISRLRNVCKLALLISYRIYRYGCWQVMTLTLASFDFQVIVPRFIWPLRYRTAIFKSPAKNDDSDSL